MLVLMAACDPGMAIYQSNHSRKAVSSGAASLSQVAIKVKTRHQLIGERSYLTQIEVTNAFDSPITVTSIELIARDVTYANKPQVQESYPHEVPSHETSALQVWFELQDDVYRIFKTPAELRVHYQHGGQEQVIHTSIVGGHLNEAPLR